MNNERKKNMYVPDEEMLAYGKSKKEADSPTDTADGFEMNEEAFENAGDGFEINDDVFGEEAIDADEVTADDSEETSEKASDNGKKDNKFIKILKKIFPTKKDAAKTIVIKSVAIVAALALIASGVYLAVYFVDLGQQDAKIDNVRNTYELNRDDYSRNDDNQFSKFDILKTQNTDIKGWISIPETEVDNPVYQCDDNQYYVTHDMDKQNNSYGALFLDYRCDIDPLSLTRNQIVYGHNMRYGAMFGTLKSYRELDFYKKSPLIYFDSLYEQRTYKIFAAMIVNDTEDDTFGYNYSAYRTVFTNDTDFMTWVDQSRQRSLIDTTVDVNAQDEIITLSTCCYDYDNARFVLLGRLVRDGESTEVDTENAVTNSDCLYSKQYYEKKGLKIPELTSSEAATSK